jgi:hypothetical protein
MTPIEAALEAIGSFEPAALIYLLKLRNDLVLIDQRCQGATAGFRARGTTNMSSSELSATNMKKNL